MSEDKFLPKWEVKSFRCLYCKAITQQRWYKAKYADPRVQGYGQIRDNNREVQISICVACSRVSFWFGGWTEIEKEQPDGTKQKVQIKDGYKFYPQTSGIAKPNPDMPEEVKKIYEEASNVVNISPKSSASLLRLALQVLMPKLGETGENINSDIASFVEKGLNPLIQQSMDIVRVIGNESVHPGQIDLNDNKETAVTLISLVNLIVEQMISIPKKVIFEI